MFGYANERQVINFARLGGSFIIVYVSDMYLLDSLRKNERAFWNIVDVLIISYNYCGCCDESLITNSPFYEDETTLYTNEETIDTAEGIIIFLFG